MRVFVTGASGAIGRRLVPQLIAAGHDVVGAHNAPSSAELLRRLGATPVRLDLLDADAVRTAVLEHEPEAILHEATASPRASPASAATPARAARSRARTIRWNRRRRSTPAGEPPR
jgi:nucleoside-diphosphate-sugar epimerase